jgi:hypothetical protein
MKIELSKTQNKTLEQHLREIEKTYTGGEAPAVAYAAALLMTVIDQVNDDLHNGLGFLDGVIQADKAKQYFYELSYRIRHPNY